MKTDLTRDERKIFDTLLPTLQLAVPMWIQRLRGTDEWQRVALAREDAQAVAERGDALMYRSKPGRSGEVFNALARGLAIAAYQPGGVTAFGEHWCTDHDVCTGAKQQKSSSEPMPPRSIVDLFLPGDEAA